MILDTETPRHRLSKLLLVTASFLAACFLGSINLSAQSCGVDEGNESWYDDHLDAVYGDIIIGNIGSEVSVYAYQVGEAVSTICKDPSVSSLAINFRVYTTDLPFGTYTLSVRVGQNVWDIADFTGFQSAQTVSGPTIYDDHVGTYVVGPNTPDELCLEMRFLPDAVPLVGGAVAVDFGVNFFDHLGTQTDQKLFDRLGDFLDYELVRQVIMGSPIVYSTLSNPPDPAAIQNGLCDVSQATYPLSSSVVIGGHLILDQPQSCIFGTSFFSGPSAAPGWYFEQDTKVTIEADNELQSRFDFIFTSACESDTWDGIYLEDNATLDLTDAIIENWSTGIVAGDNCTVILKDCSITSTVDWDGIVMGSNATLTIDGSTLERIGDKIELGEGSTFNVINDSRIEHTIGSQTIEWSGIDVGPESTINLNKANIRQADIGVRVVDGLEIAMDDTFISDCTTGMDLTDCGFTSFDRNFLQDCITGINATDNEGQMTAAVLLNMRSTDLANATTIRDVDDAIISIGNWDMAYLKIYDVVEGIYNENATRAGVEFCQINADNNAISGDNSYLAIEDNWLNDPAYGSVGSRAIRLRECHETKILRNKHIGGSNIPLFVWRSDLVTVQNNGDMTATSNSRYQTMFVSSNACKFIGNTVNTDANRAAVRVSRSHNSQWQLNNITGLQADDVVQVVASDQFNSNNRGITANRAFVGGSGSDGVVLQDSPHSHLECHDITTGNDAIKYRNGSTFTELLTNTLDGGDEDLITTSVLGIQLDHGNCFVGGSADASALTPEEVQESAFIYEANQPCVVPTSVTPSNWFFGDGVATPGCQPANGNGFTIDDNEVCDMVDILEVGHATEPNRYFIDMMHLVTYYLKDTSLVMPDCITASLDSLDPCGLVPMAEMMSKEYITQSHIDTSARSTLDYHLTEIIGSVGEDSIYHAQQIDEAGVAVAESKMVHNYVRDTTYTGVMADLQEVGCTDSIANTWKVVFGIYAEAMVADSLTIGQIKELEEAALLCADDYGDPVHWARDLLLLHNNDQTDYSTYDDCIPLINRAALIEQSSMFSLFPNPSTGIINIHGLDSEHTSTAIVYDMAGRSVAVAQLNGGQDQVDLTDLQPGVYIIELSNGASVSTHRLIITQ